MTIENKFDRNQTEAFEAKVRLGYVFSLNDENGNPQKYFQPVGPLVKCNNVQDESGARYVVEVDDGKGNFQTFVQQLGPAEKYVEPQYQFDASHLLS